LQGLRMGVMAEIKDYLKKHGVTVILIYSFVVTLLLVISYMFRPVVVSGNSMLPTLSNNETVFIERVLRRQDIKKGDIIVFHSPFEYNRLLIKRIIAVEGDTVAIVNGSVFVNGKKIFEPYINSVKSHETIPLTVVPEDCFFVLGDNRVVSSDSREFGFVRFNDIYGKLVFKPFK